MWVSSMGLSIDVSPTEQVKIKARVVSYFALNVDDSSMVEWGHEVGSGTS